MLDEKIYRAFEFLREYQLKTGKVLTITYNRAVVNSMADFFTGFIFGSVE